MLLDVGDHAHDGHPSRVGVLWALNGHPPTDRILVAEIAPRKRLIDQRRLRAVPAIQFGERTSEQERDAHRLDVSVADGHHTCIPPIGTPIDTESQEAADATEWQRADGC